MLISFILHGNKTPVSVVDIQSATKFNATFSDEFIDLINEWSIWKKWVNLVRPVSKIVPSDGIATIKGGDICGQYVGQICIPTTSNGSVNYECPCEMLLWYDGAIS